jgi:hypothetical protein
MRVGTSQENHSWWRRSASRTFWEILKISMDCGVFSRFLFTTKNPNLPTRFLWEISKFALDIPCISLEQNLLLTPLYKSGDRARKFVCYGHKDETSPPWNGIVDSKISCRASGWEGWFRRPASSRFSIGLTSDSPFNFEILSNYLALTEDRGIIACVVHLSRHFWMNIPHPSTFQPSSFA